MVTQFRDAEGRKRIRVYVETRQGAKLKDATVSLDVTSQSAILRFEPKNVDVAITTYCVMLPCAVVAPSDPASKREPGSGRVDAVVDSMGCAQLTFHAVES